jgi:hypothetical protein
LDRLKPDTDDLKRNRQDGGDLEYKFNNLKRDRPVELGSANLGPVVDTDTSTKSTWESRWRELEAEVKRLNLKIDFVAKKLHPERAR